MKKSVLFAVMMQMTIYLTAQDITISFLPKIAGTQIDSIWVTNLRTNQKVKLLGTESLLLDLPTAIEIIQNNEDNGYLYPNPGYGDATLVFSTRRNQNVVVSVYNTSGQVFGIKKLELSPGQHTFRLTFPVIGLYTVSVQTNDRKLSLNAVVMGVKMHGCRIDYAGSESREILKTATTGKTMDYKIGDILHNSVSSGRNNTILTDSPAADKVYVVEFFECKDKENQNYPIVKIGSQYWMKATLKTTKFNDGTSIPNVTDNNTWGNITSGAYCWYNNDSTYKTNYGALYNWYAVNTGKLCPTGWHVPSNAEWTTLTTLLGGESVAGGKMKETGTTHWKDPNTGATNESGFSGLPGGSRSSFGVYSYIGISGTWWSSTEVSTSYALTQYLTYNGIHVNPHEYNKDYGFSVRCVRDN